jgi:hypothetical protein
MAAFTELEQRFFALRCAGASDRRLLATLEIGREEAHGIANSIRAKLGLAPGGSIREAGRARCGTGCDAYGHALGCDE